MLDLDDKVVCLCESVSLLVDVRSSVLWLLLMSTDGGLIPLGFRKPDFFATGCFGL